MYHLYLLHTYNIAKQRLCKLSLHNKPINYVIISVWRGYILRLSDRCERKGIDREGSGICLRLREVYENVRDNL